MSLMNKKGDVHVDWAISMGIFLISVIALFVIFKPGIKPIYKETVLLDIVEDEFRKNVTWTVKKLPVFIENLGYIANNNPGIHIEFEDGKWITSTCDKSEDSAGEFSVGCGSSHSIAKCMV
ncbi:MAG: hypothetical protein AABW87_01780, partial [Nanoarchaeota archaeon]